MAAASARGVASSSLAQSTLARLRDFPEMIRGASNWQPSHGVCVSEDLRKVMFI